MFGVRCLVEQLRLFERNKVRLGLKVLGLAMYFQISSLRRTARVVSDFCMVSKTAVWKWIVNEGKDSPGNVRCRFRGYILDRKVAAETENGHRAEDCAA